MTVLLQIENSDTYRAFDPEYPVLSKHVKKSNALLKAASVPESENELDAFSALLMVDMINEHLESHGSKGDGTKKEDAHLKQDEVNLYVKKVYAKVGKAMTMFESGGNKTVKITQKIRDAGMEFHDITIKISLLKVLNY